MEDAHELAHNKSEEMLTHSAIITKLSADGSQVKATYKIDAQGRKLTATCHYAHKYSTLENHMAAAIRVTEKIQGLHESEYEHKTKVSLSSKAVSMEYGYMFLIDVDFCPKE
mgnify:CR=1 FL=1